MLNYLLLVSPNTTTFWNFKRKALLNNELSVDPELSRFILGLGTSYSISHYRSIDIHIYKIELDNLNVWLAKHPTDISGWSYLESVLDGLVSQSMVVSLSPISDDQKLLLENSTRIIQSYFEKVHDILELYPERECVWMFRRRLITFWIQLNRHKSSYNSNESIMKLLSQVEPLLPKTSDIITQLKSSKIYFTGFSFNEFLNWSYRNNLCEEPSTLKWTDMLSWRYLFWLSEYLSSLLKKLELIS
ncbi:unnamed protein product [Schistosoma curassoni]|uniref:Protein prenyltransferase alpha subunit repeat-containing protein 1 n=1 Tax=Schistosoma curassoni TaxID=6186 RepID=A0A3P8DQE1_9TREM|nr:unnamed protein product [Schistosoma curassoni]